jgi:hypothetical protein
LLLKVDFKVHSDNHERACDKITMQAFEKNSHLFVYFLFVSGFFVCLFFACFFLCFVLLLLLLLVFLFCLLLLLFHFVVTNSLKFSPLLRYLVVKCH